VATVYFELLKRFIVEPYGTFSYRKCVVLPGIKTVALCVFSVLSKNEIGNIHVTFDARSCNHCYSGESVSITYCECVCSFSYPTCNGHAPYGHLWPVRLYIIVPNYLIIDTISKRKIY
jgi:hypothetical protein